MGLKEVIERITGKKPTSQRGARGARGPREQRREANEPTAQLPAIRRDGTGAIPPAPPREPQPAAAPPPPARPAPPPPAPAAPSGGNLDPTAAIPTEPPAPPPPRARPAPSSASAGGPGSSDATVMFEVPQTSQGELAGVLVGISGDLKGEIYKVFVGDNKLGRGQNCDVHLMDARISREHATIVCEEGANAIIPLAERNPVFLNEEVVDEGAELSDGDSVRLGNPGASLFRFRTIEGT